MKPYSLYLVTSEEYSNGQTSIEIAREAIKGGIDILQMREKNKGKKELLKLGKELKDICKRDKVLFIVNDDPYLAKEFGSDGVHLGQEDIEKYDLKTVRRVIGNDKIIGLSTHSIEQFKKAKKLDCDYMSFGPIFPTLTKNYSIGIDDIKEVAANANKPVVFIGGINLSNVDGVLKEGAKIIAVIRAITAAPDVKKAAEDLKCSLRLMEKMKK